MRRIPTWGCLLGLALALVPAAPAGELDEFEKDATRDRREESSSSRIKDHDHRYFDDDDDDRLFSLMVEMLFKGTGLGMMYGGASSMARVHPDGDWEMDIEPRLAGEPLIPMFRFDADIQDPGDDLDAYSVCGIAGYGPLGRELEFHRFEEDGPDDSLDLIEWHIRYRMSFESRPERGLGFGSLTLDGGDRNSGFSFALPVAVYPHEHIRIEFRPSWASINGTTVSRYEPGMYLARDYVALKGGYRSATKR